MTPTGKTCVWQTLYTDDMRCSFAHDDSHVKRLRRLLDKGIETLQNLERDIIIIDTTKIDQYIVGGCTLYVCLGSSLASWQTHPVIAYNACLVVAGNHLAQAVDNLRFFGQNFGQTKSHSRAFWSAKRQWLKF